MLVHRRVTPSIKLAGTHLYTWVERGTVRVKCLAQEHNTMSPARARTRTARSEVERTNQEATAPPKIIVYYWLNWNCTRFTRRRVRHARGDCWLIATRASVPKLVGRSHNYSHPLTCFWITESCSQLLRSEEEWYGMVYFI